MEAYNRQDFDNMLTDDDAETYIEEILQKIDADNTCTMTQEIVAGLTFKELIQALISAKYDIGSLEALLERAQDY